MLGVELHRSWWSAKTEFCTRLATDCNLPDQWSKLHGIFEMEQLYFSLTSTALFTSVLVNSTLNYLFQVESLRVFLLLWKGSTLSFFPTASLYYFRTREELDRYLEASQIRERAIERVTNVIGTYDASAKLGFSFICLCWYIFLV